MRTYSRSKTSGDCMRQRVAEVVVNFDEATLDDAHTLRFDDDSQSPMRLGPVGFPPKVES
jgi:hypothetical protein